MSAQPEHFPLPSNTPAPAQLRLLQLGSHYLHCGVPMHAGLGKQHVFMIETTGQSIDPELEVYLSTRVLHCDECGFQMEIPD